MTLPTHMHVFVLRKMDIKRCLRMIEGDYAILGLGMHMTNVSTSTLRGDVFCIGRGVVNSLCGDRLSVSRLAHRTLETIHGTRK